jgi:transposase
MKYTSEEIEKLLAPASKEQLAKLSRNDLIELLLCEQKMRVEAYKKLEERFEIEGKFIILKKRVFGASSEKSNKTKNKKEPRQSSRNGGAKDRKLKPSERYPNAEIEDFDVVMEGDVSCERCGAEMKDSGLKEVTEQIKVIPKKYIIERHHHVAYKCTCCENLLTTPRVPRIKPGSTYSDSMIIDVAMSKYCDLLPIERYAAMASREGFMGLPPHSLIELTHYLAEFLTPIVDKIKHEIQSQDILYADETPHRMMEQEEKKSWYLWGFSSRQAAYFECRSSRSGDIASEFLKQSNCLYLVSDAYAGYSKGIRLANEKREESNKIVEVFCNAHARRKFKDIEEDKNAQFFIWCYRKIYHLQSKNTDLHWQQIYFSAMRMKAKNLQKTYPTRSTLWGACEYFLKYYNGLTLFLKNRDLPLDNNSQERLLRSPVIGRKTWHGTHSVLGGITASKLFTVVESCKLNKINPRTYVLEMVKRMHKKQEIFTPSQARKDFPQIFSQGSPPQKID